MIRSSLIFIVLVITLLLSLSTLNANAQDLNTNDDLVLSSVTLDEHDGSQVLGSESNDTITLDEDDTNDEEEEEEEEEEQYEDSDLDSDQDTTYDEEPLDGAYYGLTHHNKNQEQGDELGEELFTEYDDDDTKQDASDSEQEINDGLLFEDDEEEPLDFKNNEEIDLDQLLFEASQKDTVLEHETHDDIDQLLANADDLLSQPDDQDEDGHPDHVNDSTLTDSLFQDPPPPPISTPETASIPHTSSHYKLAPLAILALVLLYKLSTKSRKSPDDKGLPLHNKDLSLDDGRASFSPRPRRISHHYSTIKESKWEDEKQL